MICRVLAQVTGRTACRPVSSPDGKVLLIILALSFAATIMFFMTARPTEAYLAQFTPELRDYMSMVDSAQRQAAHRVFILSIPLLILTSSWISRLPCPRYFSLPPRIFARGGAIFIAAIVFFAAAPQLKNEFLNSFPDSSFAQFVLYSKSSYGLAVFASIVIYVVLGRFFSSTSGVVWSRVLWVLFFAYLLVASLPGVLTPLPFFQSGWQMVLWSDIHHGAFFGGSLRILDHQTPFIEFKVLYGLLRDMLVAAWIRLAGPMAWGDFIRLVQWGQLLYAGLAALAFYLWRPRQPWVVFLCLALVLPWVHPLHVAIAFPNHSGLRHLGLPLAALALLAARHWLPSAAALRLGAISALLLAYNPETGIAASLGFVIFGLHRIPTLTPRAILVLGMRFAAGFTAGLALVVVLLMAQISRVPAFDDLRALINFVGVNANGFAGRPWAFNPVFALIAGHSLWLSIRLALRRARGPATPDAAFLASMAAISFTWLAYYINGPDIWMLWSSLFPYAFLAAAEIFDRTAMTWVGTALRHPSPNSLMRVVSLRPLAFAVVLGPTLIGGNINMLTFLPQHLRQVYGPVAQKAIPLSGVPMIVSTETLIRQKAALVRDLDARHQGRLIYITGNSLTMPLLTGRSSGIWVRDPFYEIYMPHEHVRMISQIIESGADVVLFDDTEYSGFWWPEYQRQFYEHIQKDISSRYVFSEKRDGWALYTRKLDAP